MLDFDDIPSQVVLGDPESFQVEKLKRSIVLNAPASCRSDATVVATIRRLLSFRTGTHHCESTLLNHFYVKNW